MVNKQAKKDYFLSLQSLCASSPFKRSFLALWWLQNWKKRQGGIVMTERHSYHLVWMQVLLSQQQTEHAPRVHVKTHQLARKKR